MKNYLLLYSLIAAICLAQDTKDSLTSPVQTLTISTNAPTVVKSTNSPALPVAPATTNAPSPTFIDGVIYGSLLARRNPDLFGQPLIDMSYILWRQDQQKNGQPK